ncbi:tricarballylate utilization 4Fe-4S protein TcuB [Campylobacter sp. MIT 97-5078]|uniref:tricarballylate utilization 4Fe-4S protein TcuB n=1 Tax=Campylobacter sp. MIT 97-5078 TaxID=1548153 RepID=UPI000513D677|nr:tricarballylate utilization 4Fe-4S protein TcuB [Campylobacter sp. MIT 97-5078]KGI56492.1 citrate utilization protein B [Campylobacter sp. MIT 97-5078]TQR27989.1 tricarballylate utilization 4Fe-4S protein TcuB [Campylobacter sp. MIT 97-5078]
MKITKNYEEVHKSCIICNSCRYCEGLCAVFPAMEKKREFSLKDMDYLANLCHQCSECFYDCQYAPPHEFNVSIPKQFAALRQYSYEKYAFPNFLGLAFRKNAVLSSAILIFSLFFGFWSASVYKGENTQGDFFAIVSYDYMVSVFGIVVLLMVLALAGSVAKFYHAIKLKNLNIAVFIKSLKDALSLKYLGGHKNEGCTYPNEKRSSVRKIFHHFTAYGFLFCFIATCLGAFYHHFLNLAAPYDFAQLPKIFGVIGGIMLCIGTLGLFVLKCIADKNIVDDQSVGMDYVFIFMLFLVSFTGLLLMCLKQNSLLPYMLWLHLSCVLAFFIMAPYSKFVHMFYRFIALLKYNSEEEI